MYFNAIRLQRVRVQSVSGMTERSQELSVWEAEVSLSGQEWQKNPIVTGPEAPGIHGIDYLRRGYFKDRKGVSVGFWYSCFGDGRN